MIKTMFNVGNNGTWDFTVMSAQDAEEFIRKPHNLRIAFISITEAHGYHIDFDKSYDKIDFLPLKFDDCTTDIEGICITKEQAVNIVKFILDNKSKVDWFCFNCSAGVSRSSAVCAAAMRILCNDDMPVFKDGYFCPNMTVYREILNAWVDIISDENEKISIDHWNFWDAED